MCIRDSCLSACEVALQDPDVGRARACDNDCVHVRRRGQFCADRGLVFTSLVCASITRVDLQIKPGVEYGHVVMNVLIDHGGVERIGLADDERAGQEILSNAAIWQNLQKVLCNAGAGPVEMQRKGNNESIWPWAGNTAPEPLLSAVRYPYCGFCCVLRSNLQSFVL